MIAHRNPDRIGYTSGWAVINRGLAPACDSHDVAEPVHVYMSPPYSFQEVDTTKFNVGITMGERDDLGTYKFPFVQCCNQMDLVIVPGEWQYQVFQKNGVTAPLEILTLGHDHEAWVQPLKPRDNRHVFMLNRGRDHGGSKSEVGKYYDEITYMDCHTPRGKAWDAMTPEARAAFVEGGRYTTEEIKAAYGDADVFFKWGREGWCYPILEAMSAGCLVITNCHTLPYLRHAHNCLIFRDPVELGETLRYAAGHHCNDIKERGQQTAAELTWAKACAALREIIFKHYQAYA